MMRAFVDSMYGRVIFMGEKVYSMPIDRVVNHPELMRIPSCVDGRMVELQSLLGTQSFHMTQQAPTIVASQSVKDYLVPAKNGCLILSKLVPELRFNGRGDAKSIPQIRSTYGEIPPQLQSLIASGKLVQVSSAEVQSIKEELARLERERKELQDTRRKSARSVRRRDDAGDSPDDDGESPVRNAIPIRL